MLRKSIFILHPLVSINAFFLGLTGNEAKLKFKYDQWFERGEDAFREHRVGKGNWYQDKAVIYDNARKEY